MEMESPEWVRALGDTCRQDSGSDVSPRALRHLFHSQLPRLWPLSPLLVCWWPCLPKSRAPVLGLDSQAAGARVWQ